MNQYSRRHPAALTRLFLSAFLILGLFSSGYAQDQNPAWDIKPPASGKVLAGGKGLQSLIERYSADVRSLNRYYKFPFSPARWARFNALNQEWLAILSAIDFPRLSFDGRIDYLLLKNYLNRKLHYLQQEASEQKEIEPLLPFAGIVIDLNEDLKKMQWIKGSDAAKALNDLCKKIAAARKFLASSPTTKAIHKTVVRSAAARISTLRSGLKEWYDFYSGYDPLFTWWAAEAYKAADQALKDYDGFVRRNLLGAKSGEQFYVIRIPVGRKVLKQELAFEMLPYTPEEVLAIGWQELAWCEQQRLDATRELGFGDNWQKAMEHVKSLCVEPGAQPELIRFLTFEAIDFLEKNDSLTIPPMVKDIIRMRMMPLARQRITPFFTGGEVISVAYPTDAVPYEKKISTMRGNNPHFSRAVVHHELVPGHNLQSFMGARHKSYRRLFSTPFYGEGWPLYWEMRLWDMGFQRSPEDRIGMLFWRMHRCARIIFSLSFHLGQMTADEAVDFLVNRIGHERDNATVEAKAHLSGMAYGGQPLAQISYLTGGLQIRALSRELVDSGKMTAKAFHDAVLQENSMPIELLRAKMIKQNLKPNFTAHWEFYAFKKEGNK